MDDIDDIGEIDVRLMRVLSTRASASVTPYSVTIATATGTLDAEIHQWLSDNKSVLSTVRQFYKINGDIEFRFESLTDSVQFALMWK